MEARNRMHGVILETLVSIAMELPTAKRSYPLTWDGETELYFKSDDRQVNNKWPIPGANARPLEAVGKLK